MFTCIVYINYGWVDAYPHIPIFFRLNTVSDSTQ